VSGWIRKYDTSICRLQESHFTSKDMHRLKMKGWNIMFHANKIQNKSGLLIIISDKVVFKPKAMKTDKKIITQ
jgi:hypothetical protein